jgi:hypothetical protein
VRRAFEPSHEEAVEVHGRHWSHRTKQCTSKKIEPRNLSLGRVPVLSFFGFPQDIIRRLDLLETPGCLLVSGVGIRVRFLDQASVRRLHSAEICVTVELQVKLTKRQATVLAAILENLVQDHEERQGLSASEKSAIMREVGADEVVVAALESIDQEQAEVAEQLLQVLKG